MTTTAPAVSVAAPAAQSLAWNIDRSIIGHGFLRFPGTAVPDGHAQARRGTSRNAERIRAITFANHRDHLTVVMTRQHPGAAGGGDLSY